jgi:hypothetical protein
MMVPSVTWKAVEAGEHEEGGAVDAGSHGQAQFGVGVVVFVGLETQEEARRAARWQDQARD